MLDYNTGQSKLILREYGRNVQKLAEYLPQVEDRDKRTAYAYTLVNLMRQLNPNVKDGETTQKIWDDLFIITNFTLDVDAPFPPPPEDVLTKKPNKVPYSKESESAKYKHYGKNLEKLIEQAGELEDEEEKRDATIYLGRLMKTFYITWNRDNIDDEVIVKQLRKLSRGKLEIPLEEVKAKNLFDSTVGVSNNNSSNNSNNNNNKGRSNKGRRNNNNRRKKN